ncbi:MAG: hypothetical protein QM765_39645 [Myxococcales bacterium]
MTVYQPLVSLQRPVAIDTTANNFSGQHILLRCAKNDYLDRGDARRLCRKVQTLFTNQGATVEFEAGGKNEKDVAAAVVAPAPPTAKPDLIVELTSRLVHSDNSPLLWILSIASATLIPALTEYTFAEDIKILDGDGALLASDTLQARFMRYFGLAAWGFNGLADLLWRPDSEALTGKAMVRNFTRDYYGQLSQLAFHAHMRSRVLHDFDERPATPKPKAPALLPSATPATWPAAPAAPTAPPQPAPAWMGAPPPGVSPQPPPGVAPQPAPTTNPTTPAAPGRTTP